MSEQICPSKRRPLAQGRSVKAADMPVALGTGETARSGRRGGMRYVEARKTQVAAGKSRGPRNTLGPILTKTRD